MKRTWWAKSLCLLLCLVLLVCLAACGGSNFAKSLPGTWKTAFHTLVIYSDGTYEESMVYGTGSWTILNGNVLKLTDFYGRTSTYTISSISSDSLTLADGDTWEKLR